MFWGDVFILFSKCQPLMFFIFVDTKPLRWSSATETHWLIDWLTQCALDSVTRQLGLNAEFVNINNDIVSWNDNWHHSMDLFHAIFERNEQIAKHPILLNTVLFFLHEDKKRLKRQYYRDTFLKELVCRLLVNPVHINSSFKDILSYLCGFFNF